MSLSIILLTILSGICLLLWGLRMVKRAVLHAYGADLQSLIAKCAKNRFVAMLAGTAITIFLQSSTATALLIASFVGRGLMTVATGIALMIGADVGTAVVTHLLSFRIDWLAPLLLSGGIIMHLAASGGLQRPYIARIIIGLGFMLTALSIVREAAEPLKESATLPLILAPLQSEPLLALLVSAILTYLFHSSLSAVLLYASLAHTGILPLELAVVFVIGANIGGGFIPFIATLKDAPKALQVTAGNLMMKVIMGGIAFATLPFIMDYLQQTGADISRQIVITHLGFNLAIAVVFLPLVNLIAWVSKKIIPMIESESKKLIEPKYLDEDALKTPSTALTCATRETLHMSEVLEKMIKQSFEAIESNNLKLINTIRKEDNILDSLFRETKHYIVKLRREDLNDDEDIKSRRIINFAMNLEHCGDILDKSLMEIAEKKARNKDGFSKEGLKEIENVHSMIVESLKMAQAIFISHDQEVADKLLALKNKLKKAERDSASSHLSRLKDGLPQSIATSEIHMDIIRDYRRISTYLSSLAYNINDD